MISHTKYSDNVFYLVMRTQGSLRVVLNTKLWPSMTLEKGNEKSLRITAMDSEKDIKIYLIMVSTSPGVPGKLVI